MVESIARASGLKTGLYTSPHLVRFGERIRINGEPLTDEALEPFLDQALTVDLSFFETATLAAFLAFREHAVDLAVVEVGIGGRLDATNVLPASTVRCSAIAKIALDHTDKLGDTLGAIAREKAGIARRGVPLVHGRLSAEALLAIRTECERAGALRLEVGDYVGQLRLQGAHQRYNAGIAAAVATEVGLAPEAIVRGLATAQWPGRLERIASPRGEYILDGAHNPDGMRALVSAVTSQRLGAVIFGAMADKSWPEMLAELCKVEAPRFYVQPRGRAAASFEDLVAVAPGTAQGSVAAALAAARERAGELPVLVCGSLYLVGEARADLLGETPDPIVAL
jgi:dihydrofolate synthase/folylpolyglutamate synthase